MAAGILDVPVDQRPCGVLVELTGHALEISQRGAHPWRISLRRACIGGSEAVAVVHGRSVLTLERSKTRGFKENSPQYKQPQVARPKAWTRVRLQYTPRA